MIFFTDQLDSGYLKNVEAIVGQIKIGVKMSYHLDHIIFYLLFKSSILLSYIYVYIYIYINNQVIIAFDMI